MSQTDKNCRVVPGAELFFGESVAQYVADLSDTAYRDDADSEGFLLGKICSDSEGDYAVVSGVSTETDRPSSAIGWFRSSSVGCDPVTEDIRKVFRYFGHSGTYVILVDPREGSMAMYHIRGDVVRKVRSVMVENL